MVVYVWLLVSNGLATGPKYFRNQVRGLDYCNWHLRFAQLWERVGGIMEAGGSERDL